MQINKWKNNDLAFAITSSLLEERGMSDVAEQAKKEFEVILRFFGKREYDVVMKLTSSQGSLQVATLWMISQNSVCITNLIVTQNPKSVGPQKTACKPTLNLTLNQQTSIWSQRRLKKIFTDLCSTVMITMETAALTPLNWRFFFLPPLPSLYPTNSHYIQFAS